MKSSIRPLLLSIVAVVATVAAPARSEVIPGTGIAGPGNRDTNWNVVAVPGVWTPPASTPYQAFTLQTGAVGWGNQTAHPSQPWDNPQGGLVNADGHFYWISIQNTDASVVGFPTTSTWIVAQQFNVAAAGYYDFAFQFMSDELLDIYVNGAVAANNYTPTISGGSHVYSGGNFYNIVSATSTAAYLNAGINTIYAKVTDNGFSTGLVLSDIHYGAAAPVPEIDPAGMGSVMALVTGMLALVERRRRPVA